MQIFIKPKILAIKLCGIMFYSVFSSGVGNVGRENRMSPHDDDDIKRRSADNGCNDQEDKAPVN